MKVNENLLLKLFPLCLKQWSCYQQFILSVGAFINFPQTSAIYQSVTIILSTYINRVK